MSRTLGPCSVEGCDPRGGEHSRANAQTSHLGCNVRKGARLMEGAA